METRSVYNKHSKTDSITVDEYFKYIRGGKIKKASFQRRKRWTRQPNGKNIPSTRKYIEFLYANKNSVGGITLAKEKDSDMFQNVDGNNRTCGLDDFLEHPNLIFPEKLDIIKQYTTTNFDTDISNKIMKIFENLSYVEIIKFHYKDLKTKNQKLYDLVLKEHRDVFEDVTDEYKKSFQWDGVDDFRFDVKLNLNKFYNYTTNEMADVYASINKHSSSLTEVQIFAATLGSSREFQIKDGMLKSKLADCICEFYKKMSVGERLDCYEYQPENMNAFEFLIGITNYMSETCHAVKKIGDTEGNKQVFFKLYELLYGLNSTTSFTTQNVNQFILYVKECVKIIDNVYLFINPVEFSDGNHSKNTISKVQTLVPNHNVNFWYHIFSSIIGFIKKHQNHDEITMYIKKALLYHVLLGEVKHKEIRAAMMTHDGCKYVAGGGTSTTLAKNLLNTPENISKNVTRERMEKVLIQLNGEATTETEYETRKDGRPCKEKRRVRRMHEVILYKSYYARKMSIDYLKKIFSLEHIAPFSCTWEGQVDIDRLGNTTPTLKFLNNKRGNKHIQAVWDENQDFLNLLGEIVPKTEEYDSMVKHGLNSQTKPDIYNANAYRTICEKNEKMYIDTFLSTMW